jgi:hypothetical protein
VWNGTIALLAGVDGIAVPDGRVDCRLRLFGVAQALVVGWDFGLPASRDGHGLGGRRFVKRRDAMTWFIIGAGLGWMLATVKHKAAANPQQAAAWTSLLYGLLKR